MQFNFERELNFEKNVNNSNIKKEFKKYNKKDNDEDIYGCFYGDMENVFDLKSNQIYHLDKNNRLVNLSRLYPECNRIYFLDKTIFYGFSGLFIYNYYIYKFMDNPNN